MQDEPIEKPESPEEYLAQLERRKRKRRRVALAVAGAIAVVAFFAYAPAFFIKRASASYVACSNHDYEERPSPDTDCKSATLWLIFPKIVPWRREAAVKEEASIENSSAERALKLATSFKPDASARDRAVAELVQRSKRPNGIDPQVLFAVLSLTGAREPLSEQRALALVARNQNLVLGALIALGEIDQAKQYAKDAPPLAAEDYDSRDYFLRRGTLLCLLGERDAGIAKLKDAERVNASHHDFPFYEARVARAACGDDVAVGGDDLDRDAIWSYSLDQRLAGASLEEKLIGSWTTTNTIRDGSESPFVAAAIAERERPLEPTLSLLGALSKFPALGLTLSPWIPSAATSGWLATYPLLIDPERHEKAAARLEELAKSAPKELPPLKASERASRSMPVDTEKRYLALRKEPATSLVHYAAGFELEAAAAWAAQGHCDRAAKTAERAVILENTPDMRVLVVPLLMTCERFDRAHEVCEKGLETAPPSMTRALLLMLDAELLAHDGKFAEALARAKQATELSAKYRTESVIDSGTAIWVSTNWLELAFGLRAGDLNGAPELMTPGLEERDKIPWQRLITMPERERGPIRWRLRGEEIGIGSLTLPAQIYVIGEAVRGAGDADVWLDLELGLFDRRVGSVPGLAARAEAARWRSDSKSEELYLGRARKLRKLFSDPRKRALASLLGL